MQSSTQKDAANETDDNWEINDEMDYEASGG